MQETGLLGRKHDVHRKVAIDISGSRYTILPWLPRNGDVAGRGTISIAADIAILACTWKLPHDHQVCLTDFRTSRAVELSKCLSGLAREGWRD